MKQKFASALSLALVMAMLFTIIGHAKEKCNPSADPNSAAYQACTQAELDAAKEKDKTPNGVAVGVIAKDLGIPANVIVQTIHDANQDAGLVPGLGSDKEQTQTVIDAISAANPTEAPAVAGSPALTNTTTGTTYTMQRGKAKGIVKRTELPKNWHALTTTTSSPTIQDGVPGTATTVTLMTCLPSNHCVTVATTATFTPDGTTPADPPAGPVLTYVATVTDSGESLPIYTVTVGDTVVLYGPAKDPKGSGWGHWSSLNVCSMNGHHWQPWGRDTGRSGNWWDKLAAGLADGSLQTVALGTDCATLNEPISYP